MRLSHVTSQLFDHNAYLDTIDLMHVLPGSTVLVLYGQLLRWTLEDVMKTNQTTAVYQFGKPIIN